MGLAQVLLLSLRAIRRNVLRSTLTGLGIVIGVAAVILMVTLGNGAATKVTQDISKMGSNILTILPGQVRRGPGAAITQARGFTIRDQDVLERVLEGRALLAPTSSRPTQAIIGNQNHSTTVTGTNQEYLGIRGFELELGRPLGAADVSSGAKVCWLGATTARELFEDQDPVGVTIRIGSLACEVAGVLRSKGQASIGQDQDDLVLIPITTFQRRIAGDADIGSFTLASVTNEPAASLITELEEVLRERRRIGPGEEDDFTVLDMGEVLDTLALVTGVLTALLGAVAAISLVVGGIGIMNIMLVSVRERTREIGIRLAVGALERDVLLQFLVEAVVLTCLGGLLGIALGLGASFAVAGLLSLPVSIDPGLVLLAFGFSAFVGVVFGYLPARQAARLDPIEALRHE